MRFSKYLFLLLFVAACSSQKNLGKTDTRVAENLKSHVTFLADDKLEGRRTGSEGEKLAMEYISAQFKTLNLSPRGSDGYYQAFEVNDGKMINPGSELIINGTRLEPAQDFFPFPYSGTQQVEASPIISVQEPDMPWIIDLKETMEENKSNPHFDLPDYVRKNVAKAKERGATAVLLYNSSDIDDKLSFDPKDRSAQVSIPAFYLNKNTAEKYLKDPSATLNVKLKADIGEKKRTGHNVVGYIDNGAANTIILGAHYDHLGYGEDGSSLIRTGEKLIHNGADDNASGTAALIEIARILSTSNAKNNNYLFIAFSGEELGLYGSKYFTEHPTIDLTKVNYMINMDMVGRLNDSTKVLTIGGFGTSPQWSNVIQQQAASSSAGERLAVSNLVIRIDSSGTGPSDHTSFYSKDIPVLFYFTGLHTDYHKPSDDADKINYAGSQIIIQHIVNVISSLNDKGKLAFSKTRESQTTTSARFSVSMGIMPDYTFAGTGVRADGVTPDRPAAKAGLKTGDIILQLGEHSVISMESYMQALGKFKKGDKTKVKFKRGNETLEATVEF